MNAQAALSRREFLKLSAIAAGSVFIPPLPWEQEIESASRGALAQARVTIHAIYRYRQPSFTSERLGTLKRNEIVEIYEEIETPNDPAHNPLWYRLSQGYVHSGFLQRLDGVHLNPNPLTSVPEEGQLAQVTVPFTRSYRRTGAARWTPLYMLYYQSVHWITAVDEGPDGSPWYRLTDDRLHMHTWVPATHLKPIGAGEITPLSPFVPDEKKRIEISLKNQTLTAFEGDQIVFQTKVSTGIKSSKPSPNGIPTETPAGSFYVQTKMPSRHMGDGVLTDDVEAYELLGVPWDCFFHKDGLALHGAYWHNHFGRPMSHGCVNLRVEDALWVYRWTKPVIAAGQWFVRERGTRIVIRES